VNRGQLAYARTMPEDRGADSLDAHVRRLIADTGCWGYHTRNSKGCAKGMPDWLIVGRTGILFRELKREAGVLTAEQREVGERITRAGGNWKVWRPSDLLSGRIARELAGISLVQGTLWEAV
jgi:hypothetical protein